MHNKEIDYDNLDKYRNQVITSNNLPLSDEQWEAIKERLLADRN